MGKGKLAKFADMAEYPHVFEYPYSVVDDVPFEMKGNWNRDFFKNDHPIVLELGCGTGLSGIVAAKCGAHVLFTDKRDPPEILDNCKENCRLNGLTNYEVVMYPVSMGCRFQCSGESRFRTFPPST